MPVLYINSTTTTTTISNCLFLVISRCSFLILKSWVEISFKEMENFSDNKISRFCFANYPSKIVFCVFFSQFRVSNMATSARDIYASVGQKSEQIVIVNKKVICNELLSNVLRGIMYCNQYITNDTAMVDTLEQVFSPDAVHEARRILYKNFYNLFPDDPNDPNGGQMGAKEKEIKKRWHIQDIIEKMHVIAKIDHDIEFCVPWDYKYFIVSDEEKRFREIIKEKDLEIDTKFSALEKVIEIQNRATIRAVESVMKDALENVKDVINEKKFEGISTPIFEEAEFFKGNDI